MDRVIAHELSDQPFDLLVIGAGINGAGIARDAALRGLRVLLVDKGDIGGGTTSWPTRLIHGGLRYLEHYEVSLVRESLRERERLLRIAPHLVHPLGFLIPIYDRDRRGPRLIRLGMIGYDLLSFDKSLPRHRMFTREQALAREAGLAPEGLEGAAFYYDAQNEFPERLAVETALSAHDQGALVMTYQRAERLVVDGGRVTGVELRDERTGERRVARGALAVNVAGPWVDDVLGSLASAPHEKLIGGTKGTHIVVEPFPGAPSTALYVEATDGRPYFIVPWNDLYLIGTTDSRYEGDLDHVEATEDEIAYLLTETDRVIPGAGLRREDVLYTYAGVRPLPEMRGGKEGGITRRHIIHDHAPQVQGLISIVGGKLTTYRELAEQTVDKALRKLGREARKCRTGELPLPGGALADLDGFRRDFLASSGLPEPVATRLVRLYGARAEDVLGLTHAEPALAEVFDSESHAIGAEVVHALRAELATTLQDVMLRRTMIALGRSAGLGADRAAAEVALRHAGWDDARAEAELEAFRDRMRIFHPRGQALGAPA
jgi:glycerol-3-phosphate dehydrogenase